MLLSYTGKNVLGIGIAGPKSPDGKIGLGDIIRVIPGINEISDSDYQKIKDHPHFMKKIEMGVVQLLMMPTDKDGKKNVADMLKSIPQIFDTKLLKSIIEKDGRDAVVSSARDQLDKIKNPKRWKEEKQEHYG